MRTFLFICVHLLAILLSYSALAVVIYHWFKISIPLPEALDKSNYLAAATVILLPVLGFICIRYGNDRVHKILGYIYLILWLLAMLRFFNILSNK